MDGPCREKTLIEEIKELPPTVPDYVKERMLKKLDTEYLTIEKHNIAVEFITKTYVEDEERVKEQLKHCEASLNEALSIVSKALRIVDRED